MERVIKIYKGEETGIVRENYDSRKDSIFAEQYSMALEAINTYLDASQVRQQKSESKEDINSTVEDCSNIFAFIGDRGTGKTSCMQSVAGMLEEYYKKEHKKDLKSLVLPIIDPTIFDDKTNILQVILGVLFEKFKSSVTRKCCCNEDNEEKFEKRKNSVLEAFQNVKKCLRYISKPEELIEDGDDISKIADMSSVSKLHSSMDTLIERYLEFFDKEVLVLQVDDIDLQTRHAYRMVEEIRKYFVLKNVVILMSFKLEQLTKVIELENAKLFKPLKEFGLISSADIELMAAKYIIKLIPVNQRIFMPTFDVYADYLIEYYEDHDEKVLLIGEGGSISVKYAVTTLIYQKCRFLFYHSKGVVSPIVPRTLRELRHLLALLESMPDNSDDVVQNKHNKNAFLKYFYSNWVNNNISAEYLDVVRNIAQARDAATINKIVLQQLQAKYDTLIGDKDEDKTFKEILNEKNASYNISIADVYTVVDYIRNRKSGVDDRMLMFFISTFYSLKLYEYYDELTDSIADASKSESEGQKKKHPDSEIRTEEKTDKINNYQLLIGGLFINTDEYKLIPKTKEQTQNELKINYKLLKESAQSIIDGNEKDEYKINLIELLILCAFRLYVATAPGNTKFRTSSDLCYDFDCEKNNDYLEFDLGAFFFNVIDVESAYNRVHPGLFSHLKDKETSLYKKILSGCLEQREMEKDDAPEGEQKHAMLSCTAIRNFEVLTHFISETEYNWTDRSKGENLKNICEYFRRVVKYDIKLYARQKDESDEDRENKEPTSISFKYSQKIVEMLSESSKDGAYEEFFNNFFKVKEKTFSEFDVEAISKEITGSNYKKDTIYKNVMALCKSIFDANEGLEEEFNKLLDKETVGGTVTIKKKAIKSILNKLKPKVKVTPLY